MNKIGDARNGYLTQVQLYEKSVSATPSSSIVYHDVTSVVSYLTISTLESMRTAYPSQHDRAQLASDTLVGEIQETHWKVSQLEYLQNKQQIGKLGCILSLNFCLKDVLSLAVAGSELTNETAFSPISASVRELASRRSKCQQFTKSGSSLSKSKPSKQKL